jgi:hypothetical protein
VVNEPMSPLDPRLLDALRADRAAPTDARGRVRARLEVVVPEMRRGSSGDSGASGGHGAATAGAWGSRLTGAVALFVAGGVTGAAILAALSGSRPQRVVYVDRAVPTAAAAALTPRTPDLEEPPWSIALVPASSAAPLPPPRAAHAGPVSRASRLSAERRLLDEARAGIVEGDPARAVQQLERHRALFPDGMLVEERDAMLVEALARSGHYAEARALAGTFRTRYPGSLFGGTVDSALASIP